MAVLKLGSIVITDLMKLLLSWGHATQLTGLLLNTPTSSSSPPPGQQDPLPFPCHQRTDITHVFHEEDTRLAQDFLKDPHFQQLGLGGNSRGGGSGAGAQQQAAAATAAAGGQQRNAFTIHQHEVTNCEMHCQRSRSASRVHHRVEFVDGKVVVEDALSDDSL